MGRSMKIIKQVVPYIITAAIAFLAGVVVTLWNSPLAPPFCAITGASYAQQAMVREIEYFAGWIIVGLVLVAIPSIPLYGSWHEQHKHNKQGG